MKMIHPDEAEHAPGMDTSVESGDPFYFEFSACVRPIVCTGGAYPAPCRCATPMGIF